MKSKGCMCKVHGNELNKTYLGIKPEIFVVAVRSDGVMAYAGLYITHELVSARVEAACSDPGSCSFTPQDPLQERI